MLILNIGTLCVCDIMTGVLSQVGCAGAIFIHPPISFWHFCLNHRFACFLREMTFSLSNFFSPPIDQKPGNSNWEPILLLTGRKSPWTRCVMCKLLSKTSSLPGQKKKNVCLASYGSKSSFYSISCPPSRNVVLFKPGGVLSLMCPTLDTRFLLHPVLFVCIQRRPLTRVAGKGISGKKRTSFTHDTYSSVSAFIGMNEQTRLFKSHVTRTKWLTLHTA